MQALLRRSLSSLLGIARREVAAVVALLVIAGGSLVFIEVSDEVLDGDSREVDRAILLGLRTAGNLSVPLGPRWLERAMIDITSLGSSTCLAVITIFTAGLLIVMRKRLEALFVLAAVAGAATSMTLLKDVFARTRPDVVPHLVEVFNESFPSGHAMVSAATYLTLGTLGAHVAARSAAAYIVASAIVVTLLIGISRVYLGVHWPSDVLAGWCAGAAWAMGCWVVVIALQRRQMRQI